MSREALILIPGLRLLERGAERDRLLDAFKHSETFRCAVSDDDGPGALEGKRLGWGPRSGGARHETDVFEAHYADLVPRLQDEKPLGRLWIGTQLILFWFFSGIWRTLLHNRYLSFWTLASAVGLALWYIGLVVVGFTAIGQLTFDPENKLMTSLAEWLGTWGAWMAKWPVWVAIAFLLDTLRADTLANMSHFCRLYLADQDVRNRVRERATAILDWVLAQDYERVTVVGHSFGALIGMDLLADETRANVRLVTVGGQLAMLQKLRTWVREELVKIAGNERLAAWQDFYSDADYLCARAEVKGPRCHFVQLDVGIDAGLGARLIGAPHLAYFDRPEVVEALLVWPTSPARPGTST